MIMKESKVMDNLVNLRRGLASFLITGWLLNIVLFFYQALRLSSVTVPQLAIDLAGTVNAIYVMSVASAIYLIYSDKYRK